MTFKHPFQSKLLYQLAYTLGWGNLGYMYKLRDDELERSLTEKYLCNWVDGEFNMSQQCTLATRRVNCVLVCIKHRITSWSVEVLVLLSLCWYGLTLRTVCSFGYLRIRRTLSHSVSRGRQPRW